MHKFFKIVLIGDKKVGKKTIREKYCGKGFSKSYMVTSGADFAVKSLTLNNIEIKIQIYQLASQQRFKMVRDLYYKGSSGGIIVFDVTNKESFHNLDSWIKDLFKNSGKGQVPFIILGNKIDLRDSGHYPDCVTDDVVQSYVQKLNSEISPKNFTIIYFPVSAELGIDMDPMFKQLTEFILSS